MSTVVAATSYFVSLQLEHSLQHFFSLWKVEHQALGLISDHYGGDPGTQGSAEAEIYDWDYDQEGA